MKNFIKYIGFILSIPFVFLALLFNLLAAKIKAKKYIKFSQDVLLADRQRLVYKIFKKFIYLSHIKIDAKGFDKIPSKQLFYIANHKGTCDPLIIYVLLYDNNKLGSLSFIAKVELSRKWYSKWVGILCDTIFLQRDSGRSILDCYNKQMLNIKKGFSIAVFPEGTRVSGDIFLEFKSTTLKPAFENFLTIVPIVICGTDTKVSAKKKFVPHHVHIEVLKHIQPTEFIGMNHQTLMPVIKNAIVNKYFELKERK